MRKLVTTSLLAAAVALGFSACNNGDYTATPKKDYSSVTNPFDPTLKYNVLIGTMQGNIDGKFYTFSGYYEVDPNGVRTMYAQAQDDSMFFKKLTIVANDEAFRNKKNEDVMTTITYSFYDSTIKRNRIYQATTNVGIIKDADNKSLGGINVPLGRIEPEPVDPADTVGIRNMIFYFPKR